jgi:hypothetical protein
MRHRCFLNDTMRRSSRIVTRVVPHNVHLSDEDSTANGHGDSDYGQVHTSEVETPDVDVFPAKDITPQETGQRGAECRAKRTVVDPESHAVHCSPERAIGDGNSVVVMDVLPRLDYAGEENGGTNIRACKLLMVEGVSLPHETIVSGIHSISG